MVQLGSNNGIDKTYEGYDFITLTDASKYCDYSQEYLSLLARQKKLKAKKIGRNWYTKKEWLAEYIIDHPADTGSLLHKGSWKGSEPLENFKTKRVVDFNKEIVGDAISEDEATGLDNKFEEYAGGQVTTTKQVPVSFESRLTFHPKISRLVNKFHDQNIFSGQTLPRQRRLAIATLIVFLAASHLVYVTPSSLSLIKDDFSRLAQATTNLGRAIKQPFELVLNIPKKNTLVNQAIIYEPTLNEVILEAPEATLKILETSGQVLTSLLADFTKQSQIVASGVRASLGVGSDYLATATNEAVNKGIAGDIIDPMAKQFSEAGLNLTRNLQTYNRNLLELAVGDLSQTAQETTALGVDTKLLDKLNQSTLVAIGASGELVNFNSGEIYPFVSLTTVSNNLLLQPASGYVVAVGQGATKYLSDSEEGETRSLLVTGRLEVQKTAFVDVTSTEAAIVLMQQGAGNLLEGKNKNEKIIFSVSNQGAVKATSLAASSLQGGVISGGNLNLTGQAKVKETLTAGRLVVSGASELKDFLTVARDATFAANAIINGNLMTQGLATFASGASVGGALQVTGEISTGVLKVAGPMSATSGSFSEDLRAQNLITTGNVIAGGSLTGQTLNIAGTAIFTNLGVASMLSVGQGFSVGGSTILSGDTTTIGVDAGDIFIVNSLAQLKEPVTITKTLNVTGATTLTNLSVSGTTSFTQLTTPYQQVKTVALAGGDYATITAALTAITDATASKRYLVRVMPGIYTETVAMKEYVDIVGASGAENVTIKQVDANVVTASDNAILSGVTVSVTAATAARTAIIVADKSPSIKNVDIVYSGGTAGTGVSVTTGSPILEEVVMSGASLATGLSQTGAGGATLRRSTLTATANDVSVTGGTFYSSYNRYLGTANNLSNGAGATIQSADDIYKTTSLAGTFLPYSFGSTPLGKAPALLLQPQGTTSWETTTATYLGVNAALGFTGNLVDAQLAGVSKFKIDYQGNVTLVGATLAAGNILPSTDNTYSLGTSALRWKDLALGPASLKIYSTTGVAGAGANYTLGNFGFTGDALTIATTNTGTGVGGQINLTSAYPIGNATNSAFNLTSTVDLGVADEILQVGDSAGTFVTILGNGNVGINTVSPDRKLDVFDASNPQLRLTYTDGSVYTDLQTTSGGGLTITPTATASGVNITSANTSGTGATASLSVTGNSLTTGAGFSVASSSLTSGSLVALTATSTAAASNTQTVLNVATSGTNGTAGQTTYGGYFTNTHAGATSTNVGLYASASGGTNNYAAIFENGNVGIGTSSPRTRLELGNDGAMLAIGTFGSGWTEPDLGAGARMLWYPRKAAFRAGNVDGTQWNNANIGNYSTAMGRNTIASGNYSFAVGDSTTASGSRSTAMSGNTTASGSNSVAMGENTIASGYASAASGSTSTASGDYSFAMGISTTASGSRSIAMGDSTIAASYNSFVLGRYNIGGGTAGSWVATDALFEIGIGTSGVAKANALTVLKNGNVGIGTTGPDRKLDVLDASNPQIRLTQADGTVYTDLQNTTTSGLILTGSNLTSTSGTDLGYSATRSFVADGGAGGNTATPVFLNLAPTVNLAATGGANTSGYTGIKLNVTETAIGSGTKNLLDLQVATASKFSVSNTGAIVGVGLNAGSGLIQGTGGLTITGTANLNATGTAATNLGNSTGVLVIASGGTSSWTNTSGNLTIQTATSGTTTLDSAGILNLGTVNSTATNLGKAATTLTVNPTAWTATPTISGLITATSGLTSNGTLTVQNNSAFTQTGVGTFGTGTGAVSLNGDTTIAAGKNLALASGAGTFTQTFTGTTTTAATITGNSLTTGSLLNLTSSNNSGANTAWSANQFNVTNLQGTTAVSTGSIAGLDLQFNQNTSIAGNTETAARIAVKQNDSITTDQTVASLLSLENNDTATGNQITVTDGLKITGTNLTNGLNLSGTFGTNLITSSNFTVSQAGAIVGVGLNAGVGLIQGTGGFTLTGTTNINATGTAATNLGNSTGALVIASGGTSSWTNTSGNLTIQTATSGTTTLDSAGILNLGTVNSTATNLGKAATTLTINPTAWTATPTISGLITANAGVTLAANQNLTLNSGTGQYSQTYTGTADAFTLASSATGASNKAFNVSQTGATVGTDYGAYISNTGAATTNVGLYATASGGTNNYAAIFESGNVGIGTTGPSELLHIYSSDSINNNATRTLMRIERLYSGGVPLSGFGTAIDLYNERASSGTDYGRIEAYTGASSYQHLALGVSGTRYLDLAGNGSSLTGGVDAGISLSLTSTSNATKGNILFAGGGFIFDETNLQQTIGSTGSYYSNPLVLKRRFFNASPTFEQMISMQLNYDQSGVGQGQGIGFKFGTVSFAEIGAVAEDFTGGSEDGAVVFRTIQNGGTMTERVRINSAGNLGIGTTTPTANLQVAQGTAGVGTVSTPGSSTTLTGVGTQFTNTFKVGDTLTVTGETVRTIATITSDTVLDVTVAFSVTARSAVTYTLTGGTRFSVLGNGNVGIGTTGPDRKLDVLDASNPQIRLTQADGTVYTDLQNTTTTGLALTGSNLTSTSGIDLGYSATRSFVADGGAGGNTATPVFLNLAPTVNLAATGGANTSGYTGIKLNVTETAIGSGTKNLIDLQVATASKFSVSNTGAITSTGAIVGVGLNAGSGLIQGTGGITVTGTANLNATGTAATNLGNSTGALVIASGGTSSWTNTSGNLTIQTATSGTTTLDSAGILNLGTVNSTATNLGKAATTLTVNPTAWTATPTISGLITANAGVTLAANQNLTMSSGTGQYSQTYTGTGTNAFTITGNSLTTGNALNVSSSSITGGSLVNLASTATSVAFDGQKILNISSSGTGSSYGPTTYGVYVDNGNGGSGSVSIGGYFKASGGVTRYAGIFNGGWVGIGTDTPSAALETVANVVTPGYGQTTYAAKFIDNLAASGPDTNIAAYFSATGADTNYAGIFENGNVGIGTVAPGAKLEVVQTATATGALKGIIYTGAVNTNQTLSTEIPSLTLTTAGRQWATGALTAQREVLITQPTYSFVGASTITDAATVGIAGAPIAGTFATLTNSHGLLIQAGAVAAGTLNSYGLTVNTQTGGTNNYAAAFLGGNVGIGTTAPHGNLDVSGYVRVQGATNETGAIALGNRANTAGYYDTGIYRGAIGSLSNGNYLNLGSYAGMAFNSSAAVFGSQTTRMFIDGSNGNVGIGTTGPDRKLDVLDASNPQIRLTQADGTVYTDLQNTTTSGLILTGSNLTSTSGTDLGYSATRSFVADGGAGGNTATPVFLNLAPTMNLAATGGANTSGYTGIKLNVTETAIGSGTKNLIDLQVATASKFSVSNTGAITSTGAIVGVGLNAGSGLIQGTGGITVTGTANLNATGTAATNLGNSTGALVIASGGTSSWTNTSGNLTIQTATSGTTTLDSAGILNLGTVNSTATNLGKAATTLTVNPTAWTATPTISGLITANAGVTLAANQNLTMSSGTGQYSQTYTGTGTNAFTITGNSLTTGNALNVSSSSITGGSLVNLASTATSVAFDGQKILNISSSGTGSSYGPTTYGVYVDNGNGGSGSVSIGGYFKASGGVTRYAGIFNGGWVGIGTDTPSAALETVANVVTPGYGQTTYAAKFIDNLAASGPDTNIAAYFSATGADTNYAGIFENGNVGIGTVAPGAKLEVVQTATATGALKGIIYTGAVNTNQTLSTEIPSLTLTTAGRQWATGALTAQREVLITQPTYSFVGASTITDAATVGIAGAPIAGTFATLTNSHGLLVQAGAVAAGTINSYGLTVNTQTGATNNYAAAFMGGSVGVGTKSPTTGQLVVTQTDAANLEAVYIDTEESTNTQAVFSIETDSIVGSGADTLHFKITADGSVYSDANVYSTPADIAEMYNFVGQLEEGDVVEAVSISDALNGDTFAVQKAVLGSGRKLMGVISSKPGPVLGYDWKRPDILAQQKPVALAGRVPVKIDPGSESIEVGDYLTASIMTGRAAKATAKGWVVGKALENWQPGMSVDKIIVLMNLTFYDPENNSVQIVQNLGVQGVLNVTGQLQINGQDINSAGALSNVAYLSANNQFWGQNNFKSLFQVSNESGQVILSAGGQDNKVKVGTDLEISGSILAKVSLGTALTVAQDGDGDLLKMLGGGEEVVSINKNGSAGFVGNLSVGQLHNADAKKGDLFVTRGITILAEESYVDTLGLLQKKNLDKAIAQVFDALSDIPAGSVVALDNTDFGLVLPASDIGSDRLVGVVTNAAGIEFGSDVIASEARQSETSGIATASGLAMTGSKQVKVATSGIVKVKVTSAGGEIKPGDVLTSSTSVGLAQKASVGVINTLGIALKPFACSAAQQPTNNSQQTTQNSTSSCVGEVPLLLQVKSVKPTPYTLVEGSVDSLLSSFGEVVVVSAPSVNSVMTTEATVVPSSVKVAVEEWVKFSGKVAIADQLVVGKLAILNEVRVLKNLRVEGDISVRGDLAIEGAITLNFWEAEANTLQVGDAVAVAGEKLVRRTGSNDTSYKPALGLVASISPALPMAEGEAGGGGRRQIRVAISGVVKNLKDLQAGAVYFLAQNDATISTSTIDQLLAQVEAMANANQQPPTDNTQLNTSGPLIENGNTARGLTPQSPTETGQMVQVLGVARSQSEFVIMPSLQVSMVGSNNNTLVNSEYWNTISTGSTTSTAPILDTQTAIVTIPDSTSQVLNETNPLTNIMVDTSVVETSVISEQPVVSVEPTPDTSSPAPVEPAPLTSTAPTPDTSTTTPPAS